MWGVSERVSPFLCNKLESMGHKTGILNLFGSGNTSQTNSRFHGQVNHPLTYISQNKFG